MGKEVFESRGLNGREALVEEIKTKAGELHDLLAKIDAREEVSTSNGHVDVQTLRERSGDCKRLTAMSRTQLELSVMCAVKAVSRG